MARVALVSLNDGHVPEQSYAPVEHLGLAYLAASLRENRHTVLIRDGYALRLSNEEIADQVGSFKPDMVGITAEYNTFELAMAFAARLRAHGLTTSCPIVLGGEHATYAAEQILGDHPSVDVIAVGEGDETIVELARHLGLEGLFYSTPGTVVRDASLGTKRNPGRGRIKDLDSLPFPARDVLEECIAKGETPALGLLTSRGCQFTCSFCNANAFFRTGGGRPWAGRTAPDVVRELKELLQRIGEYIYPIVYFLDENFVGPGAGGIQRVIDFAQEVIDSSIDVRFEIFCRADSFDGQEEAVSLLKRAGLASALVGLESGIQSSLNVINKGVTVKQNLDTIALFRRYDVVTSSSGFIMFHPYSTPNELRANADFLLASGHGTLYNMSLKVLLYPGIRLIDRVRHDNLLSEDFTHFAPGRYRFANEVVSRVSNIICRIPMEIIREEDATRRHIDLTVSGIRRLVGENVNTQKVLGGLALRLQNLSRLNHSFFHRVVDLAERLSCQDVTADGRVFDVVDGYMSDRAEELKLVLDEFRFVLRRMQEFSL